MSEVSSTTCSVAPTISPDNLEADARAIYEFVQQRAFHGGGKDWDLRSDAAKQDWRDAVLALKTARVERRTREAEDSLAPSDASPTPGI